MGEHSLTPDALQFIHQAIENPYPQIGHTDLIGVGKTEGKADIHLVLILLHRVVFAAHIAAGLLHVQQNLF